MIINKPSQGPESGIIMHNQQFSHEKLQKTIHSYIFTEP